MRLRGVAMRGKSRLISLCPQGGVKLNIFRASSGAGQGRYRSQTMLNLEERSLRDGGETLLWQTYRRRLPRQIESGAEVLEDLFPNIGYRFQPFQPQIPPVQA